MSETRLAKPASSSKRLARNAPVEFPERLALYIHAMHREHASALLEALAEEPRARALAYIEELKAIDSAQRQARLTREFGTRSDALDRVAQLLVDAAPPLRRALVRHLPPALRARFPHLDVADAPCPPARDALAARLVRELIRTLA
jgi:hypothetical protein